MKITRRQMISGGIGLAGAGLMAACGDAATPSFSLQQVTEGARVTSGRTISVHYERTVRAGSLLVAVVSRLSRDTLAPTIGQVSDDRGNHWKQAVEFFGSYHYGVDIWYCESAGGGNRPVVTARGLEYPVQPGITGMNMYLLEYTGSSGFELCDQISQGEITGSSVTATTDFALVSDHELAISAIVGDMDRARAPEGWSARVADPKQGCYIADKTDTGPSSRDRHLRAMWSGLERASGGVTVMATFVRKGVSARSRRLVQSSYTDSAILPAGMGHAAWTSQPYPVDPAAGNTLVTFVNGSIYNPSIDCGSVVSVTDSAGGRWFMAGESGPDNHTGINISCWVCQSAVGGPTDLTVEFSNASQQLSCLLLEFANLPSRLSVQRVASRTFGGDTPLLSAPSPVSAGDIAFAYRTSIFVFPQGPGSPSWKQMMSDTTGANALMMLDTPAGDLTASWSGSVIAGGLDMLVLALTSGT